MTTFAVVCGVLSALIAVPPGLLIVLLLSHHRLFPVSRDMNTTDKFKGRATPEIVTHKHKQLPEEEQEFIDEEKEEIGPWQYAVPFLHTL